MRLFVCLFLLLIVYGCTKQGATGPAGPTGAAGPAGANGTMMYSGNGAPAASVGAVGDFYIDLANGVLYGPKSASGWATGFSLVGAPGAPGATGATGAAGSQILSGSGAPAAALGNDGDYYLDKANSLLYGPKTGSGWGTPVSLVGATGPQGPAGTANVIYSAWNYASNFRDTVIDASNLVVATLTASEITSAYLSNATILVYLTFGAGVFECPYSSYAGGKANTISFLPEVGQILITRFTADNSASVSLSTLLQYRFVIIPGGVYVPNAVDYPTIARTYRIPEN